MPNCEKKKRKLIFCTEKEEIRSRREEKGENLSRGQEYSEGEGLAKSRKKKKTDIAGLKKE